MIKNKNIAVVLILDWMKDNPEKGLRVYFKQESMLSMSDDCSCRNAYLEGYKYRDGWRSARAWSSQDAGKYDLTTTDKIYPIFIIRNVTSRKYHQFNYSPKMLLDFNNVEDKDVIIYDTRIEVKDLVITFERPIDLHEKMIDVGGYGTLDDPQRFHEDIARHIQSVKEPLRGSIRIGIADKDTNGYQEECFNLSNANNLRRDIQDFAKRSGYRKYDLSLGAGADIDDPTVLYILKEFNIEI